MYPKKHFMDFVQILYAGFSNFDDTNVPTQGTQFSTHAGLMQSYNVNSIEDFHKKLFGKSIFRHTDQQ